MNFSGILIGSEDPARLADYYRKLFGDPGWDDSGYTGWLIGTWAVTELSIQGVFRNILIRFQSRLELQLS